MRSVGQSPLRSIKSYFKFDHFSHILLPPFCSKTWPLPRSSRGSKVCGSPRMGYEMKLMKNRHGLSLLAGCLLLSVFILAVSQPYVIPFPNLNSQLTHVDPTSPIAESTGSSLRLETKNGTQERIPMCNPGSELCEMNGDLRISTISSTAIAASTPQQHDRTHSEQPETKNGTQERSPMCNPGSDLCETNGDLRIPNISSTAITDSSPQHQDRSDSEQPDTKNGTQARSPICSPGSDLCEVYGDLRIPNISSTAIAISAPQQQERSDSEQPDLSNQTAKQETRPLCDFSDPRSDVCEMDGDIRIHGSSSSILFLTSSQASSSQRNESWRIKPHARKGDATALSHVTEVSVISSTDKKEAPRCSVNHSIPAVVFSTGGYMGNIFHDFTDVLIPLFITSRQYEGEVQFLISQNILWWISKYEPMLKLLSRYEIIDFNMDQRVHCYPHVVVGLRSHKEMTIDPSRSPNGYSMVHFAQLTRSAFALERESAIRIGPNHAKRPRLLIIARKWTRSFKNVDEIARMAEGLGYEVVVAEADTGSDLVQFAHTVNSCDVMMGVHGAGLTNLVFLPAGAVVIQVIPLGGLEGIAWGDFGGPSLDMKVRYLDYRIDVEESTLMELYPRDHPVIKDPISVHRRGWLAVREAYLVKQNVRIDVGRFRGVLVQALELLKS